MDKKKLESQMVQAAYKKAQRRENGLTQEKLADEFSVTQGLVTQWMTGRARIPDTTLLLLSERLGFDPLEVRPGLAENFALAKKILTNEDQVQALVKKMELLSDDELDQLELLAEMMLLRREREAKD